MYQTLIVSLSALRTPVVYACSADDFSTSGNSHSVPCSKCHRSFLPHLSAQPQTSRTSLSSHRDEGLVALWGCFIVAQVPKQVTPGQGEEAQAAAEASMQGARHGDRRACRRHLPATGALSLSLASSAALPGSPRPSLAPVPSWQTCRSVCMPDTLGKCPPAPGLDWTLPC